MKLEAVAVMVRLRDTPVLEGGHHRDRLHDYPKQGSGIFYGSQLGLQSVNQEDVDSAVPPGSRLSARHFHSHTTVTAGETAAVGFDLRSHPRLKEESSHQQPQS